MLPTLLKKRLRHRCFPVNFAEFLRTRFFKNTSGGFLRKKPTSPFLNGGIFEYSVEQITVSSLTIGRYESTPKYCLHSLDVGAK